jgi:hypothetical protein
MGWHIMDKCTGCEYTAELDKHFDAIFDFMDKHDIDYAELPHIRIDIHSHMKGHHEDLGR